jgi:hypothetical protein
MSTIPARPGLLRNINRKLLLHARKCPSSNHQRQRAARLGRSRVDIQACKPSSVDATRAESRRPLGKREELTQKELREWVIPSQVF